MVLGEGVFQNEQTARDAVDECGHRAYIELDLEVVQHARGHVILLTLEKKEQH